MSFISLQKFIHLSSKNNHYRTKFLATVILTADNICFRYLSYPLLLLLLYFVVMVIFIVIVIAAVEADAANCLYKWLGGNDCLPCFSDSTQKRDQKYMLMYKSCNSVSSEQEPRLHLRHVVLQSIILQCLLFIVCFSITLFVCSFSFSFISFF